MEDMLKITDKFGFFYEVNVKHSPELGFSMAYYNGAIIGDREAQKIRKPYSDDDLEWEEYEERFAEWRDDVNSDLVRICADYFNNK